MKTALFKSILFSNIIFLLFFVGCEKRPIAKVGNSSIYNIDFQDRLKIEKVYSEEDKVDSAEVFMVLIQKFVDIEIARKMILDLTKADLIKESERIVRETKAPERLSELKKSFGKNSGRYLKNFVLPVLARRLVEEKFWLDTLHYQNEPFGKAKDYLRFMKEGKVKIDTIKGFFKVESLESNEEGTNQFFNFIKAIADTVGVKDRTLIKVIEDKTNFYCVIEKRRKKCRYFEGVIVEKKGFNEFYQKQLETIGIEIFDDKIKNRVIPLIKGTYWEKYIK